MGNREPTILLVSDDADVCGELRHELVARRPSCRVTSVSTAEAARRIVEGAAPAVIVLEESAVTPQPSGALGLVSRLHAVASWLGGYAPVAVIASGQRREELNTLRAAGVVEFVERSARWLPEAVQVVEQKLRSQAPSNLLTLDLREYDQAGEDGDFGEVLRHELNNPLTGILGNAELLLAEARRKPDGRMPEGGQQRLETIASLAVRMRETVHRLSRQWEERHDQVPGA